MAFFTSNISFYKILSIFLTLASTIATCLGSNQDLLSIQRQECIDLHFSALLRLKRSFRFDSYSYSNLSSWSPENKDCCTWEGITCDNSTGHVTSLDLGGFDLSGQIDFQSLSHLRSLQILNLGYNWFDPCPVPSAIGQLDKLTHLNLSLSRYYGQIPMEMSSLIRLVSLDLSFSVYYSIHLKLEKPSIGVLIQNMASLRELFLDYVDMSKGGNEWSEAISSALHNLRKLGMAGCGLSGSIHPSFFHLPFLSQLHLSSNNLSFTEFDFVGNLSSLTSLSLSYCALDGRYLDKILMLPSLTELDLSGNNFSSVKPHFFGNFSSFKSLTRLRLQNCSMSGPLPTQPGNFTRLELLDLSGNQMDGEIPMWIWNVGNGSLYHLNLSHNALQAVQNPNPNLSLRSLEYLDLSFNVLEGLLPVPSSLLRFYSVSNNNLNGEIPTSICNLTSLELLDVSDNNLSGRVPQCVGEMSSVLAVLHLQGNAFNGSLPQTFKQDCSLKAVDFSRNQFEGQLPISISNCKGLMALNLRSNQIHDTFPSWIQGLAELGILDLRSNHLYGPIELPPRCQNFSSKLQIMDLSSNNFNGGLPLTMFRGWMEMTGGDNSQPEYLFERALVYCGLSCETVVITSKSLEMAISKIRTDHTVLDLSNNHFQGQIPEYIGDLKSLRVLNMSHNHFTGPIPTSLKNLTVLESLDLSRNNISGHIPQELLELTFLEVLNLSGNQLSGSIPLGKQFLIFTKESFEGNPGLCGPPLPKQCGDTNDAPPPISTDEALLLESEYNWKMVAIGFGIGYGVGLGVFCWTLVLWTKGRREYNKYVNKLLLILLPSAM